MRFSNIWHLGVKELRGLVRDPMMLVLIVYSFTFQIYSGARAIPETLNKAPISIVDEDRSPLSSRIVDAFYPPHFLPPVMINRQEMDARMDAGVDTFALNIPPNFQRDMLADRQPTIQLNVDATRMTQAFTGSGYIQTIVDGEVSAFAQGYRANPAPPTHSSPFAPSATSSSASLSTHACAPDTGRPIVTVAPGSIRPRSAVTEHSVGP